MIRTKDLRDATLLIVDDSATSRMILEEKTRSWGMRPTVVGDAREALESIQHALETNRPYGLIVSDVDMPGMDGFRLAERVRQNPKLEKVPVILLTSGARSEDVKRCEELGVDIHLMKPVKESELLNAIGRALGIESPDQGKGEPPYSQWESELRGLRVLLAEDSVVNQKLALGILEKFGHEATLARNGNEAISAWSSREFDVILMDVEMPGMDGLEATAHIREKEKQTNRHTPIIAMTAHAMKGDRQRCLDAGMDDYVSKPIRVQQFLETLESVFKNRDT